MGASISTNRSSAWRVNTSGGYSQVASDGGVFSFDADFHGSLGSLPLVALVSGIASTSDGGGYRMVTGSGSVFAFGNAPFWSSAA